MPKESLYFPAANPIYRAARLRCALACSAYNALPEDASPIDRAKAWHNILGHPATPDADEDSGTNLTLLDDPRGGPAPYVKSPIRIDYGTNLYVGHTTFVNRDCKIPDSPYTSASIGEHCLIGPNVHIYAVKHALDWKDRTGSYCADVNMGDHVWIGGNITILLGVRIGDGAVVGAGSVATRDVPGGYLAMGVPARVVGGIEIERMKIESEDEEEVMQRLKESMSGRWEGVGGFVRHAASQM